MVTKAEKSRVWVTDNWNIRAGTQCFIVEEVYETENSDGEMEERTTESYFKNLEQCLKYIRNEEAKDATTVEELKQALDTAYEMDREEVKRVTQERAEYDPYRNVG